MWVICPECHCEARGALRFGRMTALRCPECHRRFRAYVGKTIVFIRRRHTEDIVYYLLLSGAITPRLFVVRDETLSEMIINRGDTVAIVYRGDRAAVIENLSTTVYWIIHDMQPPGCLATLVGTLIVAAALVLSLAT